MEYRVDAMQAIEDQLATDLLEWTVEEINSVKVNVTVDLLVLPLFLSCPSCQLTNR